MGDKIVIKEIELIKVCDDTIDLYQIDLHNETKNEWYRTFIEKTELEKMLNSAREKIEVTENE